MQNLDNSKKYSAKIGQLRYEETHRNKAKLSFTKRCEIEELYKAGVEIKKIAEKLKVHNSTIYYELKRGNTNCTDKIYSAEIGQLKYEKNIKTRFERKKENRKEGE